MRRGDALIRRWPRQIFGITRLENKFGVKHNKELVLPEPAAFRRVISSDRFAGLSDEKGCGPRRKRTMLIVQQYRLNMWHLNIERGP